MIRKLCFAIAILASTRAFADPKADAQHLIRKATDAYAAGRYAEALQDLTLAYALAPDPELLFAIGQAHMKLGDCASATTFYERFIATKSDPKEIAIANKAIKTCKDHPPEKPVAPPPEVKEEAKPPPPPSPVEVAPPPPPPPIAVRPWYRDWIGDGLVVAGVGAGVVAAVQYVGARDSRDRADTATTYVSYRDLLDQAHDKRNLAIGLAAGGGALALAGVLHYVVTGGSRESHVAVVPTAHGQVVTWTVGF